MMNQDWGYRLLGLSAFVFAGVTIAAHEFGGVPLHGTLGTVVTWIVAVAYALAGVLIQLPRTLRAGAGLIAIVFAVSAVLYLYAIAAHLSVAGIWDGLFERLGIFAGALILFARASDRPNEPLLVAMRVLFGICVVSYTLAQVLFLNATADLVPKWIPPGQMFWAILTTVAFALAAIALIVGRGALLAAQLLTLMILIFGVTIWIPKVIEASSSLFVWSEFGWNFAIAAAAWIVADWLRSRRSATP